MPLPPPLEAGDHLTRPEFELRYAAAPNVKKAELIEGIVYMPSPVSLDHSQPHLFLATWLGTYAIATPGVSAVDNGTVRLDMDNEPQPDIALFILPECGGNVTIDPDSYMSGAPELVAEVATSSASIDLNAKLRAYQRNGVLEYIVLLTRAREIRWHTLRNGAFVKREPDAAGVISNETFPGLTLDVDAMIKGDYPKVMASLSESLTSDEHNQFVIHLAKSRPTARG